MTRLHRRIIRRFEKSGGRRFLVLRSAERSLVTYERPREVCLDVCLDDHAAWRGEIEDLKADVEMWKAIAQRRGQSS